MRDALLTIFESNPQGHFSTSELVRRTHPDRYHDVIETKQGGSDNEQRRARREKAKLHRRVLYHLRNLEDEGRIATVRRTQNGEKIFTYQNHEAPRPSDITTQSLPTGAPNRSEATARLQASPHVHTPNGEEAAPTSDAVLIDAAAYHPDRLVNIVRRLTPVIADLIAITNVAKHTARHDADSVVAAINQLDEVAKQHDIAINLRITDAADIESIKAIVPPFYKQTGERLTLIYATSHTAENSSIRRSLLHNAQKTKRQAYFESTDISDQPTFVGANGPYTVPPEPWERLQASDTPVACLAHHTVSIDVHGFLSNNSISQLRTCFSDAAKHLYLKTSAARSDITLALKNTFSETHEFFVDFFNATQNYIRVWNYRGDNPSRFDSFKTLVDTATATVKSLTQKQATIFQACGIPIHTGTLIAPTFTTNTPDTFSDRAYQRRTLYDLSELRQDYWQDLLTTREETARLFSYADRTRIFRSPDDASPLAAEIHHIQTNHSLPLLCYDFQRLTKERQLQDFL